MAKKATVKVIATREELEAEMRLYAQMVLERDRLTVDMEQRIAQIRAEYEGPIAAAVQAGDAAFDNMNAWAALHPEEFAKRKSVELLHGDIGFRTGTRSVKQIAGVKVEQSVELLKAGAPEWTRTKTEIDKERILADLAAGMTKEERLRLYGLRIDQAETFWAEIKRENEGKA